MAADGAFDPFRFEWQAALPTIVRELWNSLPLSARLVAFLFANEIISTDDPDPSDV